MTIDPRHLRLVLAVAEHGTFNKAAEALGMSQPALSKSIALLEYRLGAQIFERTVRGSSLTEAGKIIARSAHNLDRLLTQAQNEIADLAAKVRGPVVIGATPSMMIGLVPTALAQLSLSEAALDITVVEDLDDKLTPALLRGDIDMLIGPVGGLRQTPPAITEHKIADERLFIGMAGAPSLSRRKEIHLRNLADRAWVLPTPGSSIHRMIEGLFVAAGMEWPRNSISTNSLLAQERIVAMTGRISIMTHAQFLWRSTQIYAIPLSGAPSRPIGIRRRSAVKLSPTADLIADLVAKVARDAGLR